MLTKSSEARTRAIVVKSGKDRRDAEMDIAGWRFECKLSGRDTGGDYCVYDTVRSVKGGPPLHIHRAQDEWFYVRSGEFLFRVGDESFRLKPGDSLFGLRGVPHAFAALTETSGLIVAFQPAGAIEELFAAACELGKSRTLAVEDWRALAAPRAVDIIGPPLQIRLNGVTMSFASAHVRRPSFGAVVAAVCLLGAVIAVGFRSTGSAMLAEAAFQQRRVSPSISDEVSAPHNAQYTAGVLSRGHAD